MEKSGYPRGNPQEDCNRLRIWWEEELRNCGLSGPVAVNYVAVGSAPRAPSGLGQALFDSLVPGLRLRSELLLPAPSCPGRAVQVLCRGYRSIAARDSRMPRS